MKVGAIVSCRMDGPGLPGRALLRLLDRPALSHLVERLRATPTAGPDGLPVILLTTERSLDDPLASFGRAQGLPVVRGPADDVAAGMLAAAQRHGLDWLVPVDDRSILIDPATLGEAVAGAVAENLDFVSTRPGGKRPRGLDVEVLRTGFLAEHLPRLEPRDRGDCTSFFLRSPDLGRRRALHAEDRPRLADLSLALESPADLRLLEFCLRHLGSSSEPVLATLGGLLERFHPAKPWTGSHGPLLVAEIGGNHEGDFEYARALTQLALDVRPDFVKFQIYTGDSLVSPVASPDRHRHFQRFELSRDQHLELVELCREAQVGYMASVWDEESLEWLDPSLEIHKVGSGDLNATGMLRALAARGKPIVLSTGLSTEPEVLEAVETLAGVDDRYRHPEWLALLQCTSLYPIEDREANLAVMRRLHELTGLPAGYSDHTVGTAALDVATAMGARVLEFHFTDRREGQSFRDHKVSLLPDEVRRLQDRCDQIVRLWGRSAKQPLAREVESGHVESFRRALYPVTDLAEGHRLRPEDLVALRPNQGIDAREIDAVVGKRLAKPLAALAPIHWTDLAED